MYYVLFDIFCGKPLHKKSSIYHEFLPPDSSLSSLLPLHGISILVLTSLVTLVTLLSFKQAHAQTSALRPPVTLQSKSNLPNNTVQAPAQAMSTTRFQTLKVNGKLVDLRTLSNNDVLTGKNGKSISVARIKQLQARLDAAKGRPALAVTTARQGQSLRSLASEPANTRIVLPNNRMVKPQDLAKVQNVYAKLSAKRVVKPLPQALNNVPAQAVVGPNLSIADALKRPASDVIQIGSRKYSVEQLRVIDSQLKASKYEPRGLVERAGSRKKPGTTTTPRSTSNVRGVQ